MIIPIRSIGKIGCLPDPDGFVLPPEAWTTSVNVRFNNNSVYRGPVFRIAGVLPSTYSPRYVMSFRQLSDAGVARFLVVNEDGTIYFWSAEGTHTSSLVSPAHPVSYVPSDYSQAYTSTVFNGLVYLNRPDRVPWYMATDGERFAELPNWNTTWRCKSLRSLSGTLVAINVTKGATNYPSMIKTSDLSTYGSYPSTWVANPTNSATENVLTELQEPLVDGWPLRDKMVLYSNNETWLMEASGDSSVFSYRRLFSGYGAINQNCVVDNTNVHYVFGSDDIWTHDGFKPKSIAENRVKDFIFQNAVMPETRQFFTGINYKLTEVYFCYLSTDTYCHFPVGGDLGYPGCNRAAVYNWTNDTWSFYDLPYVTFMGLGSTKVIPTWQHVSDQGSTWDSMGSTTWSSLVDTAHLATLTVTPDTSQTGLHLQAAVRSFEDYGSRYVEGTIDTLATGPVYLERKYLNLDDVSKDLRGYKVLTSLYPELRFLTSTHEDVSFTLGSGDYSNNDTLTYDTSMTFDGSLNYKLDYTSHGRYLSLKMTYDDYRPFVFSGIDADFTVTGRR